MNAVLTKSRAAILMNYARLQWMRVNAVIGVSCAGCAAGRVLLHFLCACGDRQFKWHLHGIVRELASAAGGAGDELVQGQN